MQKRKRVQERKRRKEGKIVRSSGLPFPISGYDPRIHLLRSPTSLIIIDEEKNASL